ncbi:MAG: hypothetical protein UT32_C0006G0022 [Parcubacteria group bacterium GW2011_GWC2_39_14]|nr:MAG: hypothetical protein UT32_C0006G0022 [Parcubacteria group bacterium GW2011_GWC2_39_14]KKR54810.1 MAG: hypothetical protein UT91_C0009G0022 [Parcubacteria group bacterium GW2011_GWA2_40_23]
MAVAKTKKKKETPIQELETLVKKDDAHIQSELHYFKGLSIMITVLIVVVFFTFGCLFVALYMEVRLMSQSMRQYIVDTHQYLTSKVENNVETIATPVVSSAYGPNQVVTEKISTADWRSFEKYGVKVFFPKEWTFADDPYAQTNMAVPAKVKAIRIFADGKVHDINQGEKGDIYIEVSDKEIVFDDQYVSKSVDDNWDTYSTKSSDGTTIYELPITSESVWAANINGKYYYIHLATEAGREIMDQIWETLEFTK